MSHPRYEATPGSVASTAAPSVTNTNSNNNNNNSQAHQAEVERVTPVDQLVSSKQFTPNPDAPPYNEADLEVMEDLDSASDATEEAFLAGGGGDAGMEELNDFTDDDSMPSSDDEETKQIAIPARRLQNDPEREHLIKSVHATLQYWDDKKAEETKKDVESLLADKKEKRRVRRNLPPPPPPPADPKNDWLHIIPVKGIALKSSSFFVFPAEMDFRVVLYNIFHHWVYELFLIFLILSYAIFQANWTWSSPESLRPPFATWVDVFYLVAYCFEAVLLMVALGFVAHKGAYLRSVWRLLDIAVIVLGILNLNDQDHFGNFTSIRILRILKSLSLLRRPIGMRLFAVTFLRSSRAILHVLAIQAYVLFFFALIGLQLFSGALHHRCASVDLTTNATTLVEPPVPCRPVSTGYFGMQWGHSCANDGQVCVEVPVNPNFNYYHFDNIGYAMWSVFNIATMQSWPALLNATNRSTAMISVLFYFFLIVAATFFVPSLALGIFMDRADKTREEFAMIQQKKP